VAAIFPDLPRPLLFAHRGASRHAPENTLDAFELGAKLGAHVLELDVHMTRDGELVVFHDPTLERTTNGRGRLCDKTFAELAELDAGYNFTLGSGLYPFRGQACEIPRLKDLLTTFPKLGFNIELKQEAPSIVRPVLDILAQVGATNILLAAANDRIMTELEAAKPGCGLGLSLGQVTRAIRAAYLRSQIKDLSGRALQIPLRHERFLRGLVPITTRRVVRIAHQNGLEVHIFTIDEPAIARRWIDRDVDGIMSNDPGALARLFPKLADPT
jgi:glycerophosphoryl diester phosphodiesterase